MDVYQKIRLARESKGYTQEDMAEELKISLQSYGKIERGKSDIAISRLKQIAEKLDLSLIQLLSFNEPKSILLPIELRHLHALLKQAFATQTISRVRTLLATHKIKARLRHLPLKIAEARLEITREELIKIIRTTEDLRLRQPRANTAAMLIEEFEVNKPYGSLTDRKSPVTIIATQNYGDAGVGHFACTLAETLNCNYIANEFYSIGAPLQERHISFDKNPTFRNFETSKNPPLASFINDIKQVDTHTKLYLYITTASGTRKNDLHLLFRGDKSVPFQSQNTTYSDLAFLEQIYKKLATELKSQGFHAGTHEEFAGKSPDWLPNALHNSLKKEVLAFCVSTKMLWLAEDIDYYQAMLPIIIVIRELMKKHTR